MKITVTRGALLDALRIVGKVAKKNSTIPVLSHALITRDSVSGTDSMHFATAAINGDGDANFRAAVDAARLSAFLAPMPADATLGLSVGANGRVTVSSGGSRLTFSAVDDSVFPAPPKATEHIATFDSETLGAAIDAVSSAISDEDTRFTMKGAYLDPANSALVGVDGHRMHVAPLAVEADGKAHLLPKTFLALVRLLSGTIKLSQGDNHYAASDGTTTVVGTKLNGNFPDYQRVLPKDPPLSWTTSGDALTAALRRVIVASDERSRAVLLTFSPDKLTITAAANDLEAAEEVAISGAGEMAINVNAAYLVDAVRAAGENVTLAGFDSVKPLVVKNESGFVAVTMPMRM